MSLPPGPRSPIALQTWQWLHSPVDFMLRQRARYGDIFTLRLATTGNVVLVGNPSVIRDIFTTPADDARAGEVAVLLKPLVGKGSMLLLDGPQHLRHRKMLVPPFHGERMRLYTSVMQSVAKRALAAMLQDAPVTLRPVMQQITLHIILKTVFGMHADAETQSLELHLLRLLDTVSSPLSSLLLVPALQVDVPFGPWRGFIRRRAQLDAAIYEVIAKRRAQPQVESDDVLGLMLQARDEQGRGLTDEELRDELVTLVVAGHETTATAMCWAVQCLLETPEVHQRLQDELDREDTSLPLAEQLPRLTYLDAVIKETLRLRPVVPIVARRLHAPMNVGGHMIEPGTVVAPCIYLTHRNPEIYPDPDAFKPERFVATKPDPYAFFPFGGGARRCIGMAFALHEMKVVLATLLRSFDINRISSRPEGTVRRAVTFAPRSGTRVKLRRRGQGTKA